MFNSAYLDDIPRPAWIAAMVIGFIWFWPVGLAILAYLVGSRRLGGRRGGPGRWYNMPEQAEAGPERAASPWASWGCGSRHGSRPAPSGNKAFDEYRAETLRRLEEEQKEFVEYLERLRQAKDKAEFDQFMADRRRPSPPPAPADGHG